MPCPIKHPLRSDLPPLTARIATLPIDERGYPVPWFVAWIDGKPDFRIADSRKRALADRDKLCWVCGQPLGRNLSFVIGPMCAITRSTAEPPNHHECAVWSVQGCPFLAKPQMIRRQHAEVVAQHKLTQAGHGIDRNPGVCVVWTTRSYQNFRDGKGGWLTEVGDPIETSWWREGRPATLAEVEESISTGLPFVRKLCQNESDHDALNEAIQKSRQYLPRA